MADIVQRIGNRLHLHLLAVLHDGGLALLHGVELVVQEDSARLLVGAEQPFNGDLEFSSRLVITLHGEVEDGVIDGAEDPAADATICLIRGGPKGIGGRWREGGAIDVRLHAKFAAHRLEERRPF